MLDKTIFAQNMNALGVIYDKTLTDELLKIYYAILQVMENEDFKQAIRGLLSERVYPTFPKPAEILQLSNIKNIELVEVDEVELKAKELIELVQGMYGEINTTHMRTRINFEILLNASKHPTVSSEDLAILESVRYPSFYGGKGYKGLIANINVFKTTKDALSAFKQAITNSSKVDTAVIENKNIHKMIKGISSVVK